MNPSVAKLIEMGVPVIPVVAGTKVPHIKDWQNLASSVPVQVLTWDAQFPGCSWAAVASTTTFFIVDDDSDVMLSMHRNTFTVESRPGHLQYYFKQTEASRKMGALTQPETGGKFSIRFDRQYGIFSGKHPSGSEYRIVNDVPMVEAPDSLIEYLRSFAPEHVKFTPTETFQFSDTDLIQSDSVMSCLEHYNVPFSQEAPGKWYVQCPWANSHTKPGPNSATAVFLSNGIIGFKCMHASCKDQNWKSVRTFLEGNRGEKERFLFHTVSKPAVSGVQAVDKVRQQAPCYPIEVWKGTIYHEYAFAASEHNNIPEAFHLEALKTTAGAIIGNGITCETYGVTPRLYTILLAPGGGGKGTAIDWATAFFKEFLGASTFSPLLWGSSDELDPTRTVIGAAIVSFGSDVGMQNAAKRQSRWLQHYEEISTLFERVGIQGSGQSLLAANRQLFDTENFTVMETAKRAGWQGRAQNSLLGATTPDLWSSMFEGTKSVGSGIFQRLSIIAYGDKIKRVAHLKIPRVRVLQGALIEKILSLQEQPIALKFSPEALSLLSTWYDGLQAQDEEGEDTGRLNVIAMRNALHLAWLHDKTVVDSEEVKGAIALADYQYEMRKQYRPNVGDNSNARIQEQIRLVLRKHGGLTLSKLKQVTHYDRPGLDIWTRAFTQLVTAGEVRKGIQGGKDVYQLMEGDND